ncbi:ArsR/SmtB family transcription factor [Clostridium luticellarii]|jgi:ArsR family transcriptional regulator|uniref:Transcriptional repressor PagR n=1 Tax=Clostridium luticellarii TaxID=1691940 RepID=A0A2T0BDL2_9CLOT|nr:metalloregulator ArsR/SmtB family transcription factor [Clostridium luticellarii]MCI1945883.1 metalloregulator ArsR/SmtB family transcription factor [Clostridium luticellarii]MCI1969122.1 metalloregulator ArsR/SmtB family transcription factor [Clostridium luticellarii]MCI1996767.1 metalloregulator ArsR/SmtB family transcription factor [Clostridium luticellarii]MCI2040547.1 metalloregulator ArsR/SmtB family transcription factor [Clostridium luticellarii]PRR81897.1 Transcriptional repressor P
MDKDFAKYNEKAEILKVLAHPVRLCIVKGLLEKGTCNVSNMQHCLEIPQSTLSQHIQKLKAAGIIEGRRNGVEINYRICNPLVVKLLEVLF